MSTLSNPSGSSVEQAALTANLKGWWKFWDNTGLTLADSSGNSNTLTASALDAGFWGTASRGLYAVAADRHYLSGSQAIELGAVTSGVRSFLVSLRINAAAVAPSSPISFLGKYGKSTPERRGHHIQLDNAGKLRQRYVHTDNGANNLQGTTDISDAADHHVAFWVDWTSETRGLYLDGADDVASGTIDLTNAVYTDKNTLTTTSEFNIGAAAGSFADQAGGIGALESASIWDVQVYITDSGLPANHLALINWLYLHPYQAIPASMW